MRVNGFTAADGAVAFQVMAPSKEAIADMIVEMRKIEYVSSFSIPSYSVAEGYIPGLEPEEPEVDENGEEIVATYVTYSFACVLAEPVEEPVVEGGAQ